MRKVTFTEKRSGFEGGGGGRVAEQGNSFHDAYVVLNFTILCYKLLCFTLVRYEPNTT